MDFRVMYQPFETDAPVHMSARVDNLVDLYRIIYRMAGQERAISLYHKFVAHQLLKDGTVIELDAQGFTKAIRGEKGTTPLELVPMETPALTPVNDEPLMVKGPELAFRRKLYKVKKIGEALWRQGYEHTVSE